MRKEIIKISSIAIALLYVDLFCGAGGTSTGIESAQIHGEKCAKVIACVNHDIKAIKSHAKNHPETVHFTEDIRTLELAPLVAHVKKMRKLYPFAKIVLWASLECTNHSKAKGGMSRNADSRTLAEHLFRYIDALEPDSIQIENVEEFLLYGPLIPKVVFKNFTSYCPLDIVKKNKYQLVPVMVKSKEYSTLTLNPQIPKIVENNGSPYCRLKKEKVDTTPKIFPVLVPDPDEKGKYYNEWVDKVKAYGYNYDYKLLNAADYGAYTSRKRLFIQFNKNSVPVVWPQPTHAKNPKPDLFQELEKWKAVKDVLDLKDEGVSIFGRKKDLVEASLERIYDGLIKFVAGGKEKFIAQYNSGKDRANSIDEPCNRFAKLHCDRTESNFLMAYYGNGYVTSIERPCPTTRTKDTFAALKTTFMDQQFGKSFPSSVDTVLGGLTANPKYNPVTVNHWIMNTNFGNVGSSIDEPNPTVTANRKWHYLMDAQYSRIGSTVDQPCFTLIARMDKTPPYLVEIDQDGDLPSFIKIIENMIIYEVYEDDTPMLIKIKEFMAHYGLRDIKMRMLKIQELKEIMGFPTNYVLIGNQADQKKFIGNAVEVTMARKICEATANELLKYRKVA